MLGVNGAGALLRSGGVTVAKQVMKIVNKKALTKTLWYPILEKVLKIFGVKKIYVNFLVELDFLKGVEVFDKDIDVTSLIHY